MSRKKKAPTPVAWVTVWDAPTRAKRSTRKRAKEPAHLIVDSAAAIEQELARDGAAAALRTVREHIEQYEPVLVADWEIPAAEAAHLVPTDRVDRIITDLRRARQPGQPMAEAALNAVPTPPRGTPAQGLANWAHEEEDARFLTTVNQILGGERNVNIPPVTDNGGMVV